MLIYEYRVLSELRNSVSKEDGDIKSSPSRKSEWKDDLNTSVDSKDSNLTIDKLDLDSHTAILESKATDWSEDSFSSEVNRMANSDWPKDRSHSIETKEEKDDWSDWDDAELESQISDEIEKELETMDLVENMTKDKKSDDNFRQKRTTTRLQKSPVHSKSGAMKLEKKVKSLDKSSKNTADNIESADSVTSPVKVAKTSPSRKHNLQKHSIEKSTTVNPNIDLGAEFDIKSVEIKVDPVKKADPFDFFADMAPTISHSKPLNEMDFTEDSGSKLMNSEMKEDGAKTKVSFDVIQTTDEVRYCLFL